MPTFTSSLRWSIGPAVLAILVACGGGGGSSEAVTPVDPPVTETETETETELAVASTPTISYGTKAFHFAWPAVPDATYYRLGEDPNSSGSFTVLDGNLTTPAFAIRDLAIIDLPVAYRYAVQACNDAGCSAWSSVATANPNQAIGIVKGQGADLAVYYSKISPDGKYMAVGTSDGFQLFESNANGWAWKQSFTIQSGIASMSFQFANDGTLIVGDGGYDGPYADSGIVQIYTKNSSGWTLSTILNPPVPKYLGTYGAFVGISADASVAFVSEIGIFQAGAMYVYRNVGGAWSLEQQIDPPVSQQGMIFGAYATMSSDGGTIVAGAQYEDSASTSDPTDASANSAGAAFVYEYSGGSWVLTTYLKAPMPTAGQLFGTTTAISEDGSTVVVGARNSDVSGQVRAGALYVFKRQGGSHLLQQTITSDTLAASEYFGGYATSLTPDGQTLLTTAIGNSSSGVGIDPDGTSGGAANSGMVKVYRFDGSEFKHVRNLKAPDSAASLSFGYSLSTSDDGKTLAVGGPGTRSMYVY